MNQSKQVWDKTQATFAEDDRISCTQHRNTQDALSSHSA